MSFILYALIAFVLFMIFNSLAGGQRTVPVTPTGKAGRRRKKNFAPLLVPGVILFGLMTLFGLDWIAHPLGALALAWYSSLVFRRRLRLDRIATALGLLFACGVLGAEWLVYPVGALTFAWFATLLFRNPSVSWTTVRPELAPFSETGEPMERVRPSRRERRRDRKAAAHAAVASPDGDLAASVEGLLSTHARRLPEEANVRLVDLGRRLRAVQHELDARGEIGGELRFLLRQTATDYAPGAVNAYLRLPPAIANVTPLADGKTGKDLLVGQLDLLLSALEAASTDVAQSAGQELLTHGRFLEDKFGKKDFDI